MGRAAKRANIPQKNRTALGEAFKELRKLGYVARQSFSCCDNCARYEIANEVAKRGGKTRKGAKQDVRGCVLYNRQATSNMNSSGTLYLAYGQLDLFGGAVGISTHDAGLEVVDVLRKHDLKVEWNGSENTKIKVDMTHCSTTEDA